MEALILNLICLSDLNGLILLRSLNLMIDKLNELFNQNQGNCQLHFTVFDPIEGYEVNLPSRSVKIQPSSNLFKELAKLDVEFRLN